MTTPEHSVPTSFEGKFNQWLTETKTNFSQLRKDAQIRIGMFQEQLKEKPSIKPIERWFRRLLVTLIVGGHLAACVPETQFVAPDNVNRVVATSTDLPPEAPETATTTTTVVEEATATPEQPAPTPTYVVEASGGAYTPAQEALNQSPEALAQQERFQRWLDYWVKFDNRPFAPGSVDIHWKPVYDNPQNPTEVVMLLEVGGPDYKNATFLPPHNADGPIDYPPEVSGSDIAPGLGPMEIDLNKDGTVTRAYQGTLARFDSQGNLVETLVGNHWEAVEKYPIDIEKLHNFPESYEYMVANLDEFVEAPDGFSDPEALYNWWTEKCIPALGNQEDLEPNVFAEVGSWPDGFYLSMSKNYSQPLLSEPSTFYFRHEDRVYPVIVLTVKTFDDINNGTFAIVLHDQSQNGDDGFAAIKRMYEGKKIGTLYGQTDNVLGGDSNQHIQLFLHSDYNWKDFICEGHTCTWSNMEPGMLWKDRPNKYAIGLGAIWTYDD